MRKALILSAILIALASQAGAQVVTKQLAIKFGSATVDGAAVWQEIEDSVCAAYQYQAQVPALDAEGKPILDAQGQPTTKPNPESKAVFVRRVVKRFLLDHRAAYLDSQGRETGLATARAGRKAEAEAP
jgi:hypothetical protein